MEWKIKLAQLGFTVLQDDKPQLYLRQLDVEKFIEQNFVTQQQVSVEPEVKVRIAEVEKQLELILKPQYENDIYSWCQIKDAIKKLK